MRGKNGLLCLVFCIVLGVMYLAGAAGQPLNEQDMRFSGMELGVNTVVDLEGILGKAERGPENLIGKSYVFPHKVTATTSVWNKHAEVYRIIVENADYATSRGIRVGSSVDDVLSRYGEPTYRDSIEGRDYYIYCLNEQTSLLRISFGADPATKLVTKIVYSATAGGL